MVEISFDYLKNNQILGENYETAQRLKKLYKIDDYRDVLINARLLSENLAKKIFELENLNANYYVAADTQHNLREDTKYLREHLDYPLIIFNLFDEIRRLGNEAVHDPNFKTSKSQAWHVLCAVNDIMVFLLNSYDGKHLYYLRPDMIVAADKFKTRQRKSSIVYTDNSNNAELAKEVLEQKKNRSHPFGKLRKFLKH